MERADPSGTKFSDFLTATVILNPDTDFTEQILPGPSPPLCVDGSPRLTRLEVTCCEQARGLLRHTHLISLSSGPTVWKQCDLNQVPEILCGLFPFIYMNKMKGLA